jgi:hypothetical protein
LALPALVDLLRRRHGELRGAASGHQGGDLAQEAAGRGRREGDQGSGALPLARREGGAGEEGEEAGGGRAHAARAIVQGPFEERLVVRREPRLQDHHERGPFVGLLFGEDRRQPLPPARRINGAHPPQHGRAVLEAPFVPQPLLLFGGLFGSGAAERPSPLLAQAGEPEPALAEHRAQRLPFVAVPRRQSRRQEGLRQSPAAGGEVLADLREKPAVLAAEDTAGDLGDRRQADRTRLLGGRHGRRGTLHHPVAGLAIDRPRAGREEKIPLRRDVREAGDEGIDRGAGRRHRTGGFAGAEEGGFEEGMHQAGLPSG